jgi:hypothetical protein
MPVVFSPGEPETRPLEPEAIVYTTAQKVADLLGVGRGEAVLMSSNAEANAVFVTGGDYRDHGFAVGDTILIYSDTDPLGLERDITTITTSTSGVKLSFSSAINPGLYETADNGYVQNTASFTNGKTRGVTKAIVETRIKEIQDRIDNITHNAWRPYLVAAEYINFDTYKPYRRRYYTDYVGTTPLLFRNVQQILRLEIWQGENYRELAGAEARLEIVDYSALAGDKLFLCPGGGGFAELAVGTNTQQWNAAFNGVVTAQNLADLINKEDRTNRGTVTFTANADSPDGTTYTQPDGSSSTGSTSVHVHNEFLATANADYGNRKLKITSMQQTKGGENATIAVTDNTNITISQTTTVTGTATFSGSGSSITFASGGAASFTEYGLIRKDGIVMGYTSNDGTVLGGVVALGGVGLSDGSYTFTQDQFKSDIGAFSDAGGDQARLKDWWLDSEMGIIYFNNSYPFFEWNAVKVSYIYGERYLEKAIEEAATKLTASELLMADDRSVLIPEGTQNVDLGSKIQLYRQEAMEILNRYKEIVVFA